MRQFLLTSALTLAASLAAAGAAQATPMLGLTVQSGSQSNFQQKTLSSSGGSYNFAAVSVGNFTADNIGTQLFSPDYIDLATFDLSSNAGGTLVITLTGTGFTSPRGASNWLTQFTGNVRQRHSHRQRQIISRQLQHPEQPRVRRRLHPAEQRQPGQQRHGVRRHRRLVCADRGGHHHHTGQHAAEPGCVGQQRSRTHVARPARDRSRQRRPVPAPHRSHRHLGGFGGQPFPHPDRPCFETGTRKAALLSAACRRPATVRQQPQVPLVKHSFPLP